MPRLLRLFACACGLAWPAFAQPADTGTVGGRIFNPASREYVRYAQIAVEGTNLTAVSEAGGAYSISGVPAGDVRLRVTFTGYRSETAAVRISAGAVTTRDFELVSSLQAAADPDAPLKLAVFTVAGEREGNAKAIMQQRSSMNITNTVASDVFGDVAEGNVGEFLKHMPGVELDLTQGEVRTIRLRGLDSEYTQVTLDGVSLASADANAGAAGNARAFSFEQVSLASMESIEVSKTISADVDANAPAGTINLKTKRAFDRAGRRVSVQANVTAHSARFNFDDSYGPDDRRSRKIHPGGIFDYSDVFFDKRLGINLNLSESMAYSANARTTATYSYAATTADPRPVVPTSLIFLHAPRTNRRSTVNFSSDFRATPRLVLSLGLLYNYADLNNPQRTLTFGTGARGTVVGTDPILNFTTSSTAASVATSPVAIVKLGQTITALPKFEYRVGAFVLEGRFSGSQSASWYDPRGRRGSMQSAGGPVNSGITFTASRSSPESADWRIVQTAGRDMDSGASFTGPVIQIDDGRSGSTEVYSGQLIASYRTRKFFPVAWKAGLKRNYEIRDFRNDTDSLRYSLNGAPALGAWADYRSRFEYDIGATNTGASLRSLGGGTVFVPDLVRLGALFRDNPGLFTQSFTGTNFYNAFIANRRNYEETIDAAYLMATATLPRLTLRAGFRTELTETDALDFDPRSPAEVNRAGFTDTAGRADTIDGLRYQYFSKPRVHRVNDYEHYFPSASLKYVFAPNFDFHFGYSTTVRRPTFRDIVGVTTINDDNFTVTTPNPALLPETSKNYSARLAYYFEPVGILAANVYQNNVKGLFITDRLTAAEFGYTGTDYAGYEFITTTSSPNDVTVRGLELEYSQSLSFLPGPFRGLGVRASYTRSYASIPRANMVPHSVNAGLNYGYRGFNVYANFSWRDRFPINVASVTPRFQRHRTSIDIGGGYRLSARFSVFFAARNLLNAPYLNLEQVGSNTPVLQFYEVTGTNWTFGVKSVW